MTIINKDTGISLTLVIAIISGLVVIGGMFLSIDRRLTAIETQGRDQWTGTMQTRFARALDSLNRGIGLNVPDCYTIQESRGRALQYHIDDSYFGSAAWAGELDKE